MARCSGGITSTGLFARGFVENLGNTVESHSVRADVKRQNHYDEQKHSRVRTLFESIGNYEA